MIHDPEDLPTDDRIIHIVTDDGKTHEVACNRDHIYWLGEHAWYRQDGEPGHWTRDEIIGWSEEIIPDEVAASLVTMADALVGIAGAAS